MTAPVGPRAALLGDGPAATELPVCDHYCGTEARMVKALALQAEMGPVPVFDITLDCEDGAPVGAEAQHAALCARIALSDGNHHGRVGVRVHPVDHPAFEADLQTLVGQAGNRLAYVMVPKPRDVADVRHAIARVQAVAVATGRGAALPVHVLVETHGALREVFAIAAEPRIESISFGLMDFVSAHRGAIPRSAMTVQPDGGQFDHPLVLRAKLDIAAACHAHGKTPSHCVVTEFKDTAALSAAATQARMRLGYTRMWSIHPDQIRPIVAAFAPTTAELAQAIEIIRAAQAAHWAPIQHQNTLHDRASYRYFWQVITRAHAAAAAGGPAVPVEVNTAWFQP